MLYLRYTHEPIIVNIIYTPISVKEMIRNANFTTQFQEAAFKTAQKTANHQSGQLNAES